MKKLFSVILSLALILSFTSGCAKKEVPAEPETKPAPPDFSIDHQFELFAEYLKNNKEFESEYYAYVMDLDMNGTLELMTSDWHITNVYQINSTADGLNPLLKNDHSFDPLLDQTRIYQTPDGNYHFYAQTSSDDYSESIMYDCYLAGSDFVSEILGKYTYGEDGKIITSKYENGQFTEMPYEEYMELTREHFENIGADANYCSSIGTFYCSDAEFEKAELSEIITELKESYASFNFTPIVDTYTFEELLGHWVLTGGEIEGWEWDASEEENAETLDIYRSADGVVLDVSSARYGEPEAALSGLKVYKFDVAYFSDSTNLWNAFYIGEDGMAYYLEINYGYELVSSYTVDYGDGTSAGGVKYYRWEPIPSVFPESCRESENEMALAQAEDCEDIKKLMEENKLIFYTKNEVYYINGIRCAIIYLADDSTYRPSIMYIAAASIEEGTQAVFLLNEYNNWESLPLG